MKKHIFEPLDHLGVSSLYALCGTPLVKLPDHIDFDAVKHIKKGSSLHYKLCKHCLSRYAKLVASKKKAPAKKKYIAPPDLVRSIEEAGTASLADVMKDQASFNDILKAASKLGAKLPELPRGLLRHKNKCWEIHVPTIANASTSYLHSGACEACSKKWNKEQDKIEAGAKKPAKPPVSKYEFKIAVDNGSGIGAPHCSCGLSKELNEETCRNGECEYMHLLSKAEDEIYRLQRLLKEAEKATFRAVVNHTVSLDDRPYKQALNMGED